MTNTKWLRRALLGGVALSVMASGAQADELGDLKAQLEALQSRVNTLESRPATTAPDGVSLLTFERGQGSLANWANTDRGGAVTQGADQPGNRGFTIGVTPTADLPAPVAEVTVYGYVKGDVIYDFETPTYTPSFYVPGYTGGDKSDHVTLHAYQTRFGIKSKVDTAIGQIRSKIEMDLFGNFGSTLGQPRLRHAYGEWDITPNWTLLVGQTWWTAGLLNLGISTVDFGYSAGPSISRTPQVRLTYHDGPLSWGGAIEKPTMNTDTAMPNLSAYLSYDIAGGHSFTVTGAVADYDIADGSARCLANSLSPVGECDGVGWAVQANANINLADIATLTLGGAYGEGEIMRYLFQEDFALWNADGDPLAAWGAVAGVSFAINDTTTFNVQYGIAKAADNAGAGNIDRTQTVHANILWQPVSQMRMGWEVMWGQSHYEGGGTEDGVRAQFGTWFFF